jgi:hypothetical protein
VRALLRCYRGLGVLGLPTGDLQQLDWSVSLTAPKGVRLRVCRSPSHCYDDTSKLAVSNESLVVFGMAWRAFTRHYMIACYKALIRECRAHWKASRYKL